MHSLELSGSAPVQRVMGSLISSLCKKMRRNKTKELTGSDNFSSFPKLRKVLGVPRHKIVRPGYVGAFKEHVVIRIPRDLEPPRRLDRMRVLFDQFEELLTESFVTLQFRPR